MKRIHIQTTIILLLTAFLFSCESGKMLNSEADIIEIILPDSLKVGNPIITNTEIRIPKLAVSPNDLDALNEQLKSLAPKFILTPGAIISDDETPRDFTEPQTYTVTSEDRKWKKDYKIYFYSSTFNNTEFSFSDFQVVEIKVQNNPSKYYYKFYEINNETDSRQDVWDSGNSGFSLTALPTTPLEDYPTSSTPNGKAGSGVKLVTRSTGMFGGLVGMPIAAGNLFLGYFDNSKATMKPLEATQFGIQTTQEQPQTLSLWAKYKAGPVYKSKDGKVQDDIIDRCEVYAVLYEAEKDENGYPVLLNGTNVRTADNIVSLAVMSEEQVEQIRVNDIENDEYVQVEIPFIPRKMFDPEKQKSGSYYITLVFSSSAKGNLFEGAIGSTLYVDEAKFLR